MSQQDIAIKIENLSKQYRLGVIGTGTLSHDIKRWWTTSVLRKEDPYLKIGETNDRASKGKSEYVWALKDINLEIKRGDVVGIIGRNGAGKSTLLKILSRVTKPSTGSIKYNGRIASLLEVGTGFHPEMTGRENIYMNGAIMGMTRAEIARKLDEIIAFAGVERYIDTPVKRYSSGMTVRLGFSIAAHLEPDILVVDEVLAVGDAEFQKKAIGKMQDVSQGGGRTVLFVSHNIGAVKSLCNSGLLLSNGQIEYSGDISEAIKRYTSKVKLLNTNTNYQKKDDYVELINFDIDNKNIIRSTDKIDVLLEYKILKSGKTPIPNVHLFTSSNQKILVSIYNGEKVPDKKGTYKTTMTIPANFLNEGSYMLGFAISSLHPELQHIYNYEAIIFDVVDDYNSVTRGGYKGKIDGIIRPLLKWHEII